MTRGWFVFVCVSALVLDLLWVLNGKKQDSWLDLALCALSVIVLLRVWESFKPKDDDEQR